uniref:YdcA family protein n=1 Tax=Ensifer adhaerens TaxID=106592 RepID=UPI003F493764
MNLPAPLSLPSPGTYVDLHRTLFVAAALITLVSVPPSAYAANEPCSGRKGGISNCQGDTFICNDGSVSGSKKSCVAYMGAVGLLNGSGAGMVPVPDGACACRSGAYCTGPRGGRFCIRDDGRKSYLKK